MYGVVGKERGLYGETTSSDRETEGASAEDSVVALPDAKATVVVNATPTETLVIDAKAAVEWKSYDVFGRPVFSGRFGPGLVRQSVLRSGYVELRAGEGN